MDDVNVSGAQQDRGLEARVLRLESEVARLQAELARVAQGENEWAQPAARVAAAPPPPPMPFTVSESSIAGPATATAGETVAGIGARGLSGAPVDGPSLSLGRGAPMFGRHREPGVSFEDKLGSQWFNRIGIVLLLLGTSWFLKLAIDRGWIVPSPIVRVIVGLLAGAGIVVWSERFRRQGFAPFSYSLKALGSGVLYLSLWAGFRMYDLLPAPVALGLMIAVTAWNAFMAWAQDAPLLAAYAMAGGFATPVLLSTGGNHEVFLFTYLWAMDAATVVLVRLKHWPRLLLGAFPATVVYFIGWYVMHWHADELAVTTLFIAAFGIAFGSVALGVPETAGSEPVVQTGKRGTLLRQILAPLANAGFVGLAMYSVLQDSGHHSWLPWMVLVLAGVYLGVMRLPQTKTVSAIHLSIAVVFLTIAIPLKASGHWITAGWLVEGLALLWVSTRLAGEADSEGAYAAGVLRWLGAAALGLGFCGIVFHLFPPNASAALWSSDTGTALLGAAVFAAAAWLALRQGSRGRWREILMGGFLGVAAVASLLAFREVLFSWASGVAHPPLASAAFGSALLALAIFAACAAICARQMSANDDEPFWPMAAAGAVLLFNVTAVLTGVREVSAMWQGVGASGAADADAALKQGLAISAYLMLYGAGLLAAGFWRRSAFLRWQGLGLLLFTIFKTFLYDMRNLSQGYRVASFLALGALLMAISYAYQRDWLALRVPAQQVPNEERVGGSGMAG